MKLTKKQCECSLRESANFTVTVENDFKEIDTIKFKETVAFEVFKQLINEHFSLIEEYKSCRQELEGFYGEMCNPPLEFEELEEGMWVWDNSVNEKNYALIKRKFTCDNDWIVAMRDDDCEDGDEYLGRVFVENRFYAREVKE